MIEVFLSIFGAYCEQKQHQQEYAATSKELNNHKSN